MKLLYRILAGLVTVLLPIALTFLGLRLLLTHAFPAIEYRLPGFPADQYGFTIQDRLKWSEISIDYLVNNADISFLGNLTFPDGTPLFNERELSHMHDVKNVVKPVLWIGYVVWFLLLGLGVWARFWRLVVAICERYLAGRLADSWFGCCAWSFRRDQFLAILYPIP